MVPSNAFTGHLRELLTDAKDLDEAHEQLRTGNPGRQYGLGALNRGMVVMCVSAWEAYVEELVRESLGSIRPPTPPLGMWPALNATIRGQLGRFNTPNTQNVRLLISDSIGLPDIHYSWTWYNCAALQAQQRLEEVMDLRHKISHGVHPRPIVYNRYSNKLPGFFQRLARCTDDAVRGHLVGALGIAHPWPV